MHRVVGEEEGGIKDIIGEVGEILIWTIDNIVSALNFPLLILVLWMWCVFVERE